MPFWPGTGPLLALFLILLHIWPSVQQECSTSQVCEIGCCSSAGFCGLGPDYCGDGCLSGCDRKADCNPGWDSPDWSTSEKCPLNVCCSKFGFCGTTDEFCGNDEVERPSCSIESTPIDRVIGYYEAWSLTERSCYGMLPEDIPFGYYTHINFAFATIDPQTFEIKPGDSLTEEYMARIGALKLIQPDLQIWIAVGGWTFNDAGQATATTFSDMAMSRDATDSFIGSLIKMMNKYGFDGLDLDWEYPVARDRNGRDEDFDNFVIMMDRIQQRLRGSGLKKGISLTLPSSYWYLQHFDIKRLEDHVDWFNIMSYDIHGSWDIDNDWTGPYANSHTNMTEVQDALDLLWRNDISPDKVVIGMAYYTRSFTLVDSGCSDPGCLVASAGIPGRCSDTTGVLLHPEIQEMISEHGVSPTLHRDAAVKTVSWGNQWVSFDDAATWRLKSNLARAQCISGVMVWAISQDDEEATNAKALTSAIGRRPMGFPDFSGPLESNEPLDVAKLCRWSGCGNCPPGFKEVKRDGTDLTMTDHTYCIEGITSKFCCPADAPAPKCTWRGHRNSGVCSPGCENDEVEVGTLDTGCNIRHQSACCKVGPAVSTYAQCKWVGSAPTCKLGGGQADCPDDYPKRIFSTSRGAGGEQPCVSGSKSYCCREPAPFTGCAWSKKPPNPSFPEFPNACEDVCHPDKVKLATEYNPGECIGGTSRAYCCDPPKFVVPRDEDSFGPGQAMEFRLLIEKYMENPTCPATILRPPVHDLFEGKTVSKRDLAMETREVEVLRGRATDCTQDTWVRLVAFATVMFTTRDSFLDPLRDIWDDEFAAYFDEQLTYDSMDGYLGYFDEFDPRSLVERALYNPLMAGDDMRRSRRIAETFCDRVITSEEGIARKRDSGSAGGRAKRLIISWGDRLGDIPGVHPIFEAINNGVMSLYYARWQWQTGSGTRSAAGPLLELAYRIPSGEAGDAFRDHNYLGTGEDEWIVFHLHVNADLPFLAHIEGYTYLGVERLSVYHGQEIRRFQEQAWRVENRDVGGRNARHGFHCTEVDGVEELWYVGAPRDEDNMDNYDWEFQRWSEGLFVGGYVASPALDLIILNAARTGNDQIDPNVPYRVARRGDTSHAAGGEDPYVINWLIDDQGLYVWRNMPPL